MQPNAMRCSSCELFIFVFGKEEDYLHCWCIGKRKAEPNRIDLDSFSLQLEITFLNVGNENTAKKSKENKNDLQSVFDYFVYC